MWCEILQDKLSQSERELRPGRRFICQQDDAPRHRGKTTQGWNKTLFLPDSCATWLSLKRRKTPHTVQSERIMFWCCICTQCVYLKKYNIWMKRTNKINEISAMCSPLDHMWTGPYFSDFHFRSCESRLGIPSTHTVVLLEIINQSIAPAQGCT